MSTAPWIRAADLLTWHIHLPLHHPHTKSLFPYPTLFRKYANGGRLLLYENCFFADDVDFLSSAQNEYYD